MRTITVLTGAFLSAILLVAIVDIYVPDHSVMTIPLMVIFFIIWIVGFGYATVPENLKKKTIAVLTIEGLALAITAGYFIVSIGFEPKYIFGLTLGVASLIIMILLREKR
jgi:hypothetical protein